MMTYPQEFKVSSSAAAGMREPWISGSLTHEEKIKVAIPPEFSGQGGAVSPEDLYALAMQNCFVATFKVMAEKAKLSYERVEAESTLTVDRDSNGQPWMSIIRMKVGVIGGEDKKATLELLEGVSESCFILNSVKTEIKFDFVV